jgi:hypothetical protein
MSPFVGVPTLISRLGKLLHPPSILLVEDQDAQAALVQAVFEEMETPILLFRVADVDQALGFLSRSVPMNRRQSQTSCSWT